MRYSPMFSYMDEIVFIWALVYLVCCNRRLFAIEQFRKIVYLIAIVIGIGIISNYSHEIQTSFFPIMMDIVSCFKVYIVYMAAYLYAETIDSTAIQESMNKVATIAQGLVLIMFPLSILNIMYVVDMGRDMRYGLPSFEFIISGAGNLSMLFYLLLSVLSFEILYINRSNTRNIFIMLLCLFTWLTTLRSRAFLFVLIFLLLCYFLFITHKNIKINIWTISLGLFIFYLVCKDQAEVYMGNDASARYNLLYGSIINANEYFPFGSGFATYGTDAAAKFYSPLYYKYGFNHVWGLAPDDLSFSHDNYWPAILGQFGYVGVLFFGLIIYNLMKHMYINTKNTDAFLISIFFIFSNSVETK